MIINPILIAVVLTALVSGAVTYIAGYIHGSYNERQDWNRLLNEDKLPHPFDRRS